MKKAVITCKIKRVEVSPEQVYPEHTDLEGCDPVLKGTPEAEPYLNVLVEDDVFDREQNCLVTEMVRINDEVADGEQVYDENGNPAFARYESVIYPETRTPAIYENILDLPAPVGGQTVVCEGVNYYHQVPQGASFDGKECLVYIQYDEKAFDYSKWSGFIGDPAVDFKQIQSSPAYARHWVETKAEALAETVEKTVTMLDVGSLLKGAKIGDVVQEKVLYDGDDADEKTPFYFGMTWDESKEHPVK